jgi:predicted transposase/invertase (TIGR01784 family)
MTHRSMAMLTLLQKHIRQHDLEHLQEKLVTLLLQGYTTEQQLTTLINYMLQAGETRNPGQLIASLATRVPAHKETLMTIAEWLREEGRQKGRIEGHQEGIREATRQIALAMLNSGLSPATVSKITGLSAQDMAQLQRQA